MYMSIVDTHKYKIYTFHKNAQGVILAKSTQQPPPPQFPIRMWIVNENSSIAHQNRFQFAVGKTFPLILLSIIHRAYTKNTAPICIRMYVVCIFVYTDITNIILHTVLCSLSIFVLFVLECLPNRLWFNPINLKIQQTPNLIIIYYWNYLLWLMFHLFR